VALTQFLLKKGLFRVTVKRGTMGYGATGLIHNPKLSPFASNLPIVLECLDTPERIAEVFPEVQEMVKEGTCVLLDGTIWGE